MRPYGVEKPLVSRRCQRCGLCLIQKVGDRAPSQSSPDSV